MMKITEPWLFVFAGMFVGFMIGYYLTKREERNEDKDNTTS